MKKQINKIFLAFALMIITTLIFPTLSEASTIKVLIATNPSTVTFTVSEGEYEITNVSLSDSYITTAEKGDVLTFTFNSSSTTISKNGEVITSCIGDIRVYAVDSDDLNVLYYQEKNVEYRDNFHLLSNGYVVNVIDLENYLYGVVGREISSSSPIEALKTQAITSRSYAYVQIGTGTYYDVQANTYDQAYGGYTVETMAGMDDVIKAIDETSGIVMVYYASDGTRYQVTGYYSTHAGGYTENNENVWYGTALPYLRGVASPYDDAGPDSYDSWTITYAEEEFVELVNDYKDTDIGELVEIIVEDDQYNGTGNTASGRLSMVQVVGTKDTVTVYRDSLRGFLNTKSTLFTITSSYVSDSDPIESVYVMGADGEATETLWSKICLLASNLVTALFGDVSEPAIISADGITYLNGTTSTDIVLTGSGYGHGVGLSQWGAVGMAQVGYTYEEILSLYFGGTDPDGSLEFEKVD